MYRPQQTCSQAEVYPAVRGWQAVRKEVRGTHRNSAVLRVAAQAAVLGIRRLHLDPRQHRPQAPQQEIRLQTNKSGLRQIQRNSVRSIPRQLRRFPTVQDRPLVHDSLQRTDNRGNYIPQGEDSRPREKEASAP